MIKLHLHRIAHKSNYIIGRLYIDDEYFCDTLEPSLSRRQYMAIPTGNYSVVMSPSQRFKAMRPFLVNVPGRSGIMIHEGNKPADTHGCILVGRNTIVGQVTRSKNAILTICNIMAARIRTGEKCIITVD